MTPITAHTYITITAILACSILAGIDLLHGGDGATITGSFAVISALAGYSMGQTTKLTSQ